MRVVSRQVEGQPLTVIVEYPEYTRSTADLIKRINDLDIRFCANDDGKQIKVDLADICYMENVDRKLFIYTEKDVYRYESTMAEALKLTAGTDMVRISRTCLMNTEHLKEIRQIRNSHLEAVLDNGEKLIVSRKYLKDIKEVFKRG